MKTKLILDKIIRWTNPTDIPGQVEHSRGDRDPQYEVFSWNGGAHSSGRIGPRAIEHIAKEEINSMPVSQKKIAVSKFPLRLMPSVRRVAENFSQKEGVSLNQFINIAVAEMLAHLQHEEWLAHRPKATDALIAKALDVLDRSSGQAPEMDDKLPNRYVSIPRKYTRKKS
jgi:hypothetical protein